MCTAISWTNGSNYFGRNLDWYIFYPVQIAIAPRHYTFNWRNGGSTDSHYAIMGMAMPFNNIPLYFDAINDQGLGMAGLNDRNAHYFPPEEGKTNIATFEFISYILAQCKNVEEAKKILSNAVLTDQAFAPDLATSPMHWFIADKDSSIVVESNADGLHVYDDPINCLTNAPEFPYQLQNLKFYRNVSPHEPEFEFSNKVADQFPAYGTGNGTMGLPGGIDSISRFVRVAYTLLNSVADATEDESVSQYFHIMQNVGQVRGESVFDGHLEVTQFTTCYNTTKHLMYYSTYGNQSLNAVDMTKEDLESKDLILLPVHRELQVNFQN